MEKKFREFQNEHLLLCFKLCTDNCVLKCTARRPSNSTCCLLDETKAIC